MPRALKFDLIARRLSELSVFPDEASLFWSSRPYPLLVVEGLDVSHGFTGGAFYAPYLDSLDLSHALISADLRQPLQTYSNWPSESVDVAHSFTGGQIRPILQTYNNWPSESVDVTHSFTGGAMPVVLRTYANWPVESVDVSHSFTGGTL